MPPHGPHVTLRVVLAGREAQVDPSGAPARDRPARRQLDGGPRAPPAPKGKIEKLRHFSVLYREISYRELFKSWARF